MKDFLVIFLESGGARVEKHPEYIKLHKNDSNVLLNPELPEGISPSKWIKIGDSIGILDDHQSHHNIHNKFHDERIVRLENDRLLLEEKNKKSENNMINIHIILSEKNKRLMILNTILLISLISSIIIGVACHL